MWKLLKRVRADLVSALTDDERRQLVELVDAETPSVPPPALTPAKSARAREPQDFAAALRQPMRDRNLTAGKAGYSQAGCAGCHRITGNDATKAAALGPDQTGFGARFGSDALLLHVVEPSLIIDEKYQQPDAPNVSTMPSGLPSSLDRGRVLDLLRRFPSSTVPNDLCDAVPTPYLQRDNDDLRKYEGPAEWRDYRCRALIGKATLVHAFRRPSAAAARRAATRNAAKKTKDRTDLSDAMALK